MKPGIIQIISLSIPLLLPLSGNGALLGTRQRTVAPVALPTNTTPIMASDLPAYAVYGYSSWQWGPGQDDGQLTTNMMPSGYPGATNAARLLTFFCISDIHITDKESTCQPIWPGYQTVTGFTTNSTAPGNGNSSCYSPVILRTTQVLDAAVKTANEINRLMPFDFGMSLGDDCNSTEYNELRWFIDVMDGKPITPSSGTNAGATTIDYQMPFQAVGLDASIPWYQVLGNHDHFWSGCEVVDDYFRQTYTNNTVLLLGDLATQGLSSRAEYMGVVDGNTPDGNVIGAGSVTNYIAGGVTNAPTVAPDPNRYSLTRSNWMREFFTTTSKPVGHGFSQANVTNDFACYTFEPKANLPLKVIVLDDTMTDQNFDFNGQGGLDTNQLAWLVHELDRGQAQNKLMIVTAHIPIELIGYPPGISTNSVISSSNLLVKLHTYPNLILWVAGHMHRNNIKAEPSPYPDRPEYGFWQVENPSLRDFPQEFRTYEILRNTDNSISIRVTDIDPDAPTNSQAAISRGYAVGASRIFASPSTNLTDTASYTRNAELVKLLTPPMQARIAGLGEPLGDKVAIDQDGTEVKINFLGELLSADNLYGPWTGVTNISPYSVSAVNGAKFYRAAE
jgi:metallophosphoesterase (TIGR03768 family)